MVGGGVGGERGHKRCLRAPVGSDCGVKTAGPVWVPALTPAADPVRCPGPVTSH